MKTQTTLSENIVAGILSIAIFSTLLSIFFTLYTAFEISLFTAGKL